MDYKQHGNTSSGVTVKDNVSDLVTAKASLKSNIQSTDWNRKPLVSSRTGGTMLSPTGSEVGLMAMDTDPQTSSGTTTPTMARTRPRVPTGLLQRHKNVLVAAAAAVVTSGTVTPPRPHGSIKVENLMVDFDSLGRTDFVRKYSTKVRSNSDQIHRFGKQGSFQGQVDGESPPPHSIPNASPGALIIPGEDMERDRSVRPHTLGGAPSRSRSIKLKLEKLKDARRSSDPRRPDPRQLNASTIASMIRNQGNDMLDSNSSCDTPQGMSTEAGAPTDTYCTPIFNTLPRGHLRKLELAHSHPPIGEERRYHTLPHHHSASPKEYSPSPSDLEVRDTLSKTVASDRRLWHQDSNEPLYVETKLTPEPSGLQSPPQISSQPALAPDPTDDGPADSIGGTSPRPTRLTRPAVVHWQLGRDSTESINDTASKRLSEVAEDEGVDVGAALSDPQQTDYHKIKIPPFLRSGEGAHDGARKVSSSDDKPAESSGDTVICGASKLPNGRFLTHPPIKDRVSITEGGPKDTNGFGSLRDHHHVELTDNDLTAQLSCASVDSHQCTEEVPESYHEVVEVVTAEPNDLDKLERKNSKTLKQKSKSDPCGEKQRDNLWTPPVDNAQSTPLLIDESLESAQEFSRSLSVSSHKPTSVSDSALAYTGQGDQGPDILTENKDGSLPQETAFMKEAHRSSSRKRNNRTIRESKEKPSLSASRSEDSNDESTQTRNKDNNLPPCPITKIIEPRSGSNTPEIESPEGTLEKNRKYPKDQKSTGISSLTLPFSKKGTAIQRSHSSASVFLNKAEQFRGTGNQSASPGSTRQKELAKKRPQLGDHLGISSGALDLSTQKKERPWGASSTGYFPSLEPIYSQSTLSLFEGTDEGKNKRDLIVREFYSTEEQYVEALQMLVERYMIPMKTQGILDRRQGDDIFYKVNEIYMHHATFQTFLGKALQDWNSETSTIGDIIHRNFSKQTVIESYMSFIENFPRAEKALDEISTKSSFQKFIEVCEREMKMRLPLKAHIVKPAQRIPRYELLLRRLLDNTPRDHPDHPLLVAAEKSIHQLALRINSSKESRQEEDYQETLKKLELLLITDLAAADRIYVRHDMVQILSRKDQCCIWLFSDLAVFSSVKRKSGPVNRRTTLLLQSPTGNDFVENCKHKMWLKISLEDLEIVHLELSPAKKPAVDVEQLQSDSDALKQMTELMEKLTSEHQTLEEAVKELMEQVTQQLEEQQRRSPSPDANKIELMANTTEGLEHLMLLFPSQDKKVSWENAFMAAKQKLASLAQGKPPEFSQALPITKTRAGMQFSCAAPIEGFNDKHFHDVWVCNSDGYVGHMCLLSLQPEPIVTLNTPVPGCNSRILCICAVPALYGAHKRKGSRRRLGVSQVSAPQILIQEAKSPSDQEKANKRHRPRVTVRKQESSSSSTDEESSTSSDSGHEEDETDSKLRKVSTGSAKGSKSTTPTARSPPSTPAPSARNAKSLDPQKSTMWLGTEDGCILVFPSTENMKTTKNKIKLQQNAGILAICYLEFKVFASLANGEMVVYTNNPDGTWDFSNPATFSPTTTAQPVNKMLGVAGRLWCACQHEVLVVNPATLKVEVKFCGNPDAKKPVQCMATSGHGVWLASQGSPKITLFHALTHQMLAQISVAPIVAQKLQNADDIIRQHKTACLRITSLLICKDQLWIGTSAGVILTLPVPKISQATTKNSINLGTMQGLVHGHTGHVRFLSCVDMSPQPSRDSTGSQDGTMVAWRSRRMSLGVHNFSMVARMLVISGGDGYEDFRSALPSESAGRDDSTNHLLLWQV